MSGFLYGGTNFFLTDVPLGRTLAVTNSPGGITAFAANGISGCLKVGSLGMVEGWFVAVFILG